MELQLITFQQCPTSLIWASCGSLTWFTAGLHTTAAVWTDLPVLCRRCESSDRRLFKNSNGKWKCETYIKLPLLFFHLGRQSECFWKPVLRITHIHLGKSPRQKLRDLMRLPCVADKVGKLDFFSSSPEASWCQHSVAGGEVQQRSNSGLSTARTEPQRPFAALSRLFHCAETLSGSDENCLGRSSHFAAASVHRLTIPAWLCRHWLLSAK